jgi:hypothetical protein
MNNLPNEILLKIFSNVSWIYQLYHPLNLVCKKWDILIQKYGIDFDTDYKITISIILKYEFIKSDLKIIRDYGDKKILLFNINRNYNRKLVENILLRIPAYKFQLTGFGFVYTPKLKKFHDKHVTSLRFIHNKENYYPIKSQSLALDNTAFYIPTNLNYLQNLSLMHMNFDSNILSFVKTCSNLIKIRLFQCKFYLSENDNLSDILSILRERERENINIRFSIQCCHLNKPEFYSVNRGDLYFVHSLYLWLEKGEWIKGPYPSNRFFL